jgi:hypothetical protein
MTEVLCNPLSSPLAAFLITTKLKQEKDIVFSFSNKNVEGTKIKDNNNVFGNSSVAIHIAKTNKRDDILGKTENDQILVKLFNLPSLIDSKLGRFCN